MRELESAWASLLIGTCQYGRPPLLEGRVISEGKNYAHKQYFFHRATESRRVVFRDCDGKLLSDKELSELFVEDIPRLCEYYGNDEEVTYEAWLGEMILNGLIVPTDE